MGVQCSSDSTPVSDRRQRIHWRPHRAKPGKLSALILGTLLVLAVAGTAIPATAQAADPVYYRLVQYPEAGRGDFYAQIGAARHSIDMEMYELSDRVAERELARAVQRGVSVRVLLDHDYSGAYVNAPAYAYLTHHGVQVRWAPAGYIFHIKVTSFDARVADVSTANLTAEYYSSTRDALVIDSNPAQVQAIEQTFANDWAAAPGGAPRNQTVQAPGLVWSPNTQSGTAETAMVAQIKRARHTVDFESEELSDAPVYEALAADADRGVNCKLVMTADRAWDRALAAVTKAGCRVHVFPDTAGALYIHEKLVLDDPGTAQQSVLVGSQNASWPSLTENRELSLQIGGANGGVAVIRALAAGFDQDFADSSGWN